MEIKARRDKKRQALRLVEAMKNDGMHVGLDACKDVHFDVFFTHSDGEFGRGKRLPYYSKEEPVFDWDMSHSSWTEACETMLRFCCRKITSGTDEFSHVVRWVAAHTLHPVKTTNDLRDFFLVEALAA